MNMIFRENRKRYTKVNTFIHEMKTYWCIMGKVRGETGVKGNIDINEYHIYIYTQG